MWFVGEARARLAAFPVVVLAVPLHCALLGPGDTGDRDAPADAAGPVTPAAFAVTPAALRVVVPLGEPGAAPRVMRHWRSAPIETGGGGKQEAEVGRVASAPARQPSRSMVTLPDEVVVMAIAAGQPAFLRCWARAQRLDGASPGKVQLHLEIDATGKVTASHSDSESQELTRCLAVVARQLAFPAPGKAAVVDLPLMFR